MMDTSMASRTAGLHAVLDEEERHGSAPSDSIHFSLNALDIRDEVRGPEHYVLTRPGFDYVFFDWKGTLAKKSGLDSKQRATKRLEKFYEALLQVLAYPSGEEVEVRITTAAEMEKDEERQKDDVEEASTSTSRTAGRDPPTREEVRRAYDELMKEHKGDDGTKTFAWGTFIEALLHRLGLHGLSKADQHKLILAFQVGAASDSGMYPGAMEILRWLREDANLPVGLIRNSKLNEHAMRTRIAKAGLDPSHFESVVMGGEVGCAKPDPEVFVTAARSANIEHIHAAEPKRILFIGNEVDADVVGANGVGWTSVLVKHTEDDSRGLADYEIDHLEEIKNIVLRMRDDAEEKVTSREL